MTDFAADERAALLGFLSRVRDEALALGRPLHAVWRAREADARRAEALERIGEDRDAPHFALALPARGVALAASGELATIETHGADRFAAADREAHALFADLRIAPDVATDAPPEAGPILVGGFAFDDEPAPSTRWHGFPSLRFWLPERLIARVGAERWRTDVFRVGPSCDEPARMLASREARIRAACAPIAPFAHASAPSFRIASDRSPDAYLATVAHALESIDAGELEKLVVARACTLRGDDGFDLARLFRGLRAQHPACFVFAVGRKGATFVGASPERLLRRTGTRVSASVLAGSAPRGRTPEEDERLGRALAENKKEQAEHAIVRRAVCDALAPVCASIDAPEAPLLLRLDGIQHLHTPVEATLRDGGIGLLPLAARLHPTPAVGGAPREAALGWLAANESLERGWYAGGVGWLAPSGDGELAVALRSALLRGDEATLFAGAGVVAGSTPAGELAETRLKLRTLLTGLMEI